MLEELRRNEKIAMCNLIKDGLNTNVFKAQDLLERKLGGASINIDDIKSLGRVLSLSFFIPKIKMFCAPEIEPDTFNIYKDRLNIIIKDMSITE